MSRGCSVDGCGRPHAARGLCWSHYYRACRAGSLPETKLVRRDRFIAEAVRHTGNECLIWPFGRDRDGYGVTERRPGRSRQAHRVICELVHGAPPTPKHETAHSCGNGFGGCVNPNHLRWATSAENKADMLIHGTRWYGRARRALDAQADQSEATA